MVQEVDAPLEMGASACWLLLLARCSRVIQLWGMMRTFPPYPL